MYFSNPGASAKSDEEEFVRVLEGRAKTGDNKLKVVDVGRNEKEVEVKEIKVCSLETPYRAKSLIKYSGWRWVSPKVQL